MNPWFEIEEIDSDTFAISEYKHWESPHSYLVCGTRRAVLIDTGLGVSDIKRETDTLTSLPVSVFNTHVHWDHIGGNQLFDHVAVHGLEKDWIADRFPLSLETVKKNLTRFPCEFPKDFDLEKYTIYQGLPDLLFFDGDIFDLGNRTIRVIHTPGHSPGHCCFYDPDRKYLFSGDLIYKGCLDAFYPSTDPVLFYSSVQKVKDFRISKILPGHYQLHISTGLLSEIEAGFSELNRCGQLRHGEGIFDFGDFRIHL